MNRQDKYKSKLKTLLKNSHKYDFSEFLCVLRNISGCDRDFVASDIGISRSRMTAIEKGTFVKPPPDWQLKLVAGYYEIDVDLLKEKVSQFIEDGKSKPSKKVG